MGKIINTLKNGTGKAKLVIILAFLSCLAAVGFIVIAIALKQLLYFFGTVICSFIAISLKQTLDVYEYQGELYGDGKAPEKPKENSESEEFPDFYGEEASLDSSVTEEEKPEEKKEENKKDKKAKKKDKKKKVKEPKPKKDKKEKKKDEQQDEIHSEELDATLLDETVEEELLNQEPQDEEIETDEQEYDEQEYEEENEEQENTDDEMEEEDVNSLLDKMNNLLDAADVDYNDEDMNMDEFDEIISESDDKEEISDKHKHKHKEKTKKEKLKKEKTKKGKIKKFGKKKEVEEEPKKEETPDKGVIQENMLEDELEKDLQFLKTNIAGNFDNADDKDEEDEDKKKLRIVKPVSEDEAASYDRSKIKKTLHKYKVKKDHRLILIDHCDKYYIEQTPAYVWVSDKEFNLLLIEEEPRHLVLPLYGIKEITYLKKCPVNSDTDYPLFHKKNLLTDTFRPYLPDYTQSTVMTDLTSYKNLYGFGPGIYCTNRSAKNLFDLLSVEFRVDDKVTMSNKVNIYFKECYKAGILLRDGVIDANGYADSISRTLDDMAKSTISNNEFKETLNLLVRNKIITKEFSDHYMDVRDKMRFS